MENASVVIQGEALLKTVGEIVRRARKGKGWTQAELGQQAGGKNKETINRLEAGENTRVLTLDDVANALGTTSDAILASARASQSIAHIGPNTAGGQTSNDQSSPVTHSGVQHQRRSTTRTTAEADVGGPDGSHAGPPPDWSVTPLPQDEEFIDRMREHADLLHYTANRFRQHTQFLWNFIAAFDAGQIRSDRTPRPPAAHGPTGRDRRPSQRSRHSKRTG